MIKTLHLRRVKAVEDSGVISLGALNAFIGRNGSGKSSIVEFLELLSNAVEINLQQAAKPFRRGRDLIRSWNGRRTVEALLSLRFDPGDVSAGTIVRYDFGITAPGDGESLSISTERLLVGDEDSPEEIVYTEDETRFYRVPPTRIASKVKRQSRVSKAAKVGERSGSDWIRVDDSSTPALKHVDRLFSQGGHALRTWLERIVTLRLSPSAVAEFAPKRQMRGLKGLDPAGNQTAELLAALFDDERRAVLDKQGRGRPCALRPVRAPPPLDGRLACDQTSPG